MNDKIIIYSDDKVKIEISTQLHNILEELTSGGRRLATSPEEFAFLIQIAAEVLKDNGISFKSPIASRAIPIIEFGRYQVFEPPYDVFNSAVEIMSEYISFIGVEEEIENRINEMKDGSLCFCHIFPCVIKNTSGFLYSEKDGTSILLFFIHSNDV